MKNNSHTQNVILHTLYFFYNEIWTIIQQYSYYLHSLTLHINHKSSLCLASGPVSCIPYLFEVFQPSSF